MRFKRENYFQLYEFDLVYIFDRFRTSNIGITTFYIMYLNQEYSRISALCPTINIIIV